MDPSVFWPLWFRQLGVHQDYAWFLVLLAWSFALVFWWWHPERRTTWAWLPWMAGACVAGAAVQFAIFNPPFDFFHSRLIPGKTADFAPELIPVELFGDWVTAIAFAGGIAGWGWIAAGRRAWSWAALIASGLACLWHIAQPARGAGVFALGALLVGVIWIVRHRPGRGQGALVLAAAAVPLFSTVGPVAALLGELQLAGPPTAMGFAAASYQALVGLVLLAAMGRRVVGAPSRQTAFVGVRWLLVGSVLWLVGGLGFAHQTGADNREELQRNRLRITAARASLLDPELLQAIDSPPLALGRLERNLVEGGLLAVPEETARLSREVSRALHREWRAAPHVMGARLVVVEDGWLLALADSRPTAVPGTVEVLRRATERDLADWREGRNVIEHSPVPEIGAPYFCRAALRSPDGRMLGWLEFEQVEFFQSIARKWRSGPLLVTALGLVLGATLLFQQRATREREAALRAAAVQAEANRLKSEFLAKVSHELRTPLQSLLGYSELLRGRVAAEPQAAAWLDAVRQHGELMTRLVNDLIDLGAVQAGTLRLQPRVAAPGDLLRAAVEGLRPRAAAKGLALHCVVDASVPAAVELDDARLRQVVFNLVGNAVKFTARGEVAVRLGAEPAGAGGVRLVLAVSDTGPGIAPEDRARLFTAFARLEPTAQQEGAGVGLALTAALCAAMGGGIIVESEPGRGSTFTATVVGRTARAEDLPALPAARDANLAGRRVLVVDDNLLVRELFQSVLLAAGAQVSGVATLAEARAALAAEDFAAVVLDVSLPDGSGFALAEELRAAGRSLRVIGASAHAGDAERAQARDAGMNAFLVKPVAPSELVAAVGVPGASAPARTPLPAPAAIEALFRAEARAKEAELARAVAAGDWRTVRAAAHHLANSASVVRDRALQEACNALVEAAERGAADAVQRHWAECAARLATWTAPGTEIA